MIDYSNLRKALDNLEAQHDNWLHLDEGLSQLSKDGIAESVIQRFEIAYDLLLRHTTMMGIKHKRR